jgi:metal-responsive CopG/Arc/MetJ family transcriptional regulator
MKTAISIPDAVFAAAERLARQLKMSRSELFTKAVAAFLHHHSQDGVTEALNAVYGSNGRKGHIDPVVEKLQFGILEDEGW